MRYHEICKLVDTASISVSSVYLEQGDVGLTEDLVEGFVAGVRSRRADRGFRRRSFTSARELVAELDDVPMETTHRAFVVRDAHRVFTPTSIESVLLRMDREKRSNRVRLIFVGDEPAERVKEWFTGNRTYGEVSEPTFEKLGNWAATKTAGRWDYRRPTGALITPETGLKLMEHVGWDYTAAIQAAKTIRVMADGMMEWPQVSALVPPKPGYGYAEALVFGKGRRSALTLAEGIPAGDTLRTLGLVRFYLRQLARLRAIEAGSMSDRAASEESGVHVWHWRQRYKPVYPSYTNDRIRLRMEATEQTMLAAKAGAVTGVLEQLVLVW